MKRVITSTSRQPRPGERDGVDYHFLSSEKFADLERAGYFAETDGTETRRYGVQWKALADIWTQGLVPIAAITYKGVIAVHEKYPLALRIFIRPMEATDLEGRLRKRSPEMSKDELQERIIIAKRELDFAHRNHDVIVINEDGKHEEAIKYILYLIDGYVNDPVFKAAKAQVSSFNLKTWLHRMIDRF